jgi:hypothetical protein
MSSNNRPPRRRDRSVPRRAPSRKRRTVAARRVCDFCGVPLAQRAVTAFACHDFLLSLASGVAVWFRNAWLACPVCAPLVHDRAWAGLIDLVVAVHPLGESARSSTARLYQALNVSLTGGYVTWGGGVG